MTPTFRSLFITLAFFIFLQSCDNPNVIKDLSGDTFQLIDSDSAAVDFPSDFNGDVVAVSFIYTHCPDVCPLITANLSNIQNQLQDTSGIHFVEISFDPKRDTPSVLRKYKGLYGLNNQFSLLTGDSTNINSVLGRLDIVAEKTYADSMDSTSGNYFMRHTNRLYLVDRKGRVRFQYPASVVPPENVIEDIKKIR
ncbi:MAG: SCO family protein [Balneolaceae bacterium]|jgi:protein SCO1/2